jgi:hypothetical protein
VKIVEEKNIRHAVKHLAMGNLTLAIRDLLRHPDGAMKVAKYLAHNIREGEMKTTCSPTSLTSLRHYDQRSAFTAFTWPDLYHDLQNTLPLLMNFIEHIIPAKNRQPLKNAMCVIAGMIAKANSNQMNMIQDMLSIVLYGGRTTASVSYVH